MFKSRGQPRSERAGASRFLVALALALIGCADPATEQAKREFEAAKLNLMAEAAFYWRCTHQAVVVAGDCRQWSEAYERDLAAFKAQYGDANE